MTVDQDENHYPESDPESDLRLQNFFQADKILQSRFQSTDAVDIFRNERHPKNRQILQGIHSELEWSVRYLERRQILFLFICWGTIACKLKIHGTHRYLWFRKINSETAKNGCWKQNERKAAELRNYKPSFVKTSINNIASLLNVKLADHTALKVLARSRFGQFEPWLRNHPNIDPCLEVGDILFTQVWPRCMLEIRYLHSET